MIHSWYLVFYGITRREFSKKLDDVPGGVRMHLLPAAGLEPALQHTDTAIL
jgi:hypothetical protein